MSRQENAQRGQNALKFAKNFGFTVEKVKPILRNLVKLYESNWEFIEEDNYKALLDALLESDDGPDQNKRSASSAEHNHGVKILEPSCKRQKTDEAPQVPQMHSEQKGKAVLACQSGQGKINGSASNAKLLPMSAAFTEPAPKCIPERVSRVELKVPKAEPGTEHDSVLPKTDTIIGDFVPIAVIHPSSSCSVEINVRPNSDPIPNEDNSMKENVSSMQENLLDNLGSQSNASNQVDHDDVEKCNGTESNLAVSSTHEIASTSRNEVKLTLTCDKALSQNGFHMPDLDMVLQHVENKCLRSLKIIEPSFSLKVLMQEICNSVLDLGTEDKASNEEDGPVTIATDLEPLKRYNPFDAPTENLARASNAHINERTLLDLSSRGENVGPSEAQNLPIVQRSGYSIDDIRPLHDVNDISKGEESVPVSIVNEVCSEPSPPSFYYIPKNMVHQNAYVNFSLARIGDENCCPDCFGDCLSSSIPCACARETGGEYAYTLDGLAKREFLNACISMNREPHKHPRVYCQDCPLERTKNGDVPEPCKGHLMRKFIKECWSKCGCSKQCGNRVVQRGITCNLQVFFTQEGKGWGLRTLDELPRGTFVCEYVGEILTNTELYERNARSSGNVKHNYPVLLDADWGSEGVLKDEEALCLDATFYGNVARFINHRCFDASLVEIPVEVETPDHHYYHLAFFTTRKVEPLEELTWDYGIDFEDVDHPVKAFRCKCGSQFCRDVKRPAGRLRRPSLSSSSKPKERI